MKYWLPFLLLLMPSTLWASGFGVFTQGAKGLGQANAVVAHPTGPSSLYFNPALLTEVPGSQIEIGTTGITVDRNYKSSYTFKTTKADDDWSIPSTLFYTYQKDKLAAGMGVYFPFGLSTEWPSDYDGRYIATFGDIFSVNFNPAVAYKVSDKLSLAAGLDVVYMSAELKSNINQAFAGFARPPALGGPIFDLTMPDIKQKFDGDGWGAGFNLGLFYKINQTFGLGVSYRSEIDVDIEGDATFTNVDPRLALLFPDGGGDTNITLPQQLAAGLAMHPTSNLIVEVGVRWEDWSSTEELVINLDQPVLGQGSQITPRDWRATWAYNIGGEYRVSDTVTLLAGYLYGEAAVPASTFEPLIPETDAHLFTLGTELGFDSWTVSAAGGYEHHEDGVKNNLIGDPLDQAGLNPASYANGNYETDIYLVAVSVGYAF